MEKKFTPGPWVIGDENNQHAQVCLGDSNCSVDLRRFADYPNCPDMSRDEMLANASLIAAAPDLYDALESCLPWLEEQSTDECADAQEGGRPNWKFNGIYNAALAALAKARGEA